MAEVYILENEVDHGDYGTSLVGVFDSEDKATEAAKKAIGSKIEVRA